MDPQLVAAWKLFLSDEPDAATYVLWAGHLLDTADLNDAERLELIHARELKRLEIAAGTRGTMH